MMSTSLPPTLSYLTEFSVFIIHLLGPELFVLTEKCRVSDPLSLSL